LDSTFGVVEELSEDWEEKLNELREQLDKYQRECRETTSKLKVLLSTALKQLSEQKELLKSLSSEWNGFQGYHQVITKSS
jgi:chromosome segregation ATPase